MSTLFISCVSNEFGTYRDALRKDFTRPNLGTKIQEDFYVNGGPTLEKLDEYIKHCDAVVHICGDMTGSMANRISVAYIIAQYPDFAKRLHVLQTVLEGKAELSYSQWEAYLAIYHGKRLFIAKPIENSIRSAKYVKDSVQNALQINHLQWLNQLGFYAEIEFSNEDELAKKLYQSKLGDILNSIPRNKPINLPYQSIGENFKGRAAFIDNLQTSFIESGSGLTTLAIHGLGGIGKTRLAVEYAWLQKEEFSALLFINADQPQVFRTNIAILARVMDLPEKEVKEDEVKYAAVIKWLNTFKGWLLILDNVDTQEAAEGVEEFLGGLQQGTVFITTRIAQWSGGVKTKALDLLSKEASKAFLLETTANSRLKQANDAEISGLIAEDLGFLALALEQARAYIEKMEISLEGYRKTWQTNRQKMMGWLDKRVMQYNRSVAITWQTSFDQLSSEAKTLLNRLAWFAPDPIPKSILEVRSTEIALIDSITAWAELNQLSLSSSSPDKISFSIHRLVQEVTRTSMEQSMAEKSLDEALHWVNEAFLGDPSNVRDWPELEPFVPHMQFLTEAAFGKGILDPTNILCNQLGLLYLSKAQYNLAEPLMRRALEIDEASYGADHPDVAIRLGNLAQLLQDTNRHGEAEPLMRRALRIDEARSGADLPDVAIRLNNLAALLLTTNRLGEAEPLMRRALEIDEASYGADHPRVATDLNNLAALFQDTNRLGEAEPLIRRALGIDESSYGVEHPMVAIRLNNLAQLLQDTNRLGEAEPLMRRALGIDEASYGGEHPRVAIHLNNLAALFQDTNRLGEAEPLIRRALGIDEASYGADNPNVARDLNNLSQLLKATNRLGEAEPLMRRALGIDESSYGANHPDVARDLNNLAQLLQDTNRLGEAEPLMRRALVIFCISLGIEHPNTEIVINNYYSLLSEMGKTEEHINLILSGLFE